MKTLSGVQNSSTSRDYYLTQGFRPIKNRDELKLDSIVASCLDGESFMNLWFIGYVNHAYNTSIDIKRFDGREGSGEKRAWKTYCTLRNMEKGYLILDNEWDR